MASRSDIMAGRAFVELYVKKEGLTQGLANARQRLQDWGNAANAMGRTLLAMGLITGTSLLFASKSFASFDDQMRAVKAAVNANEADFRRLTDVAKELGKTSGFTATQVGELMLELGRAGFDPKQIEQMTESVLQLSRATGTNAATSAGIMSAALRQFNLGADQAKRVADGLTAAANMSFSSVESLGEALSYAGPVANDFAMQIEDVLAIMGALGNIGIQGSEAGTVVRRLLTITAADAAKLSQIFGVAFVDAKGNARPLIDTLEEVNNKTKNLGSATRSAKFNEAFGLLGITGASALGKAAGSVKQLAKDIREAGGIAAATAKEMDAGPGGAWRRMMGMIDSTVNKIGEALVPSFMLATDNARQFAEMIGVIVDRNQGLINTLAQVSVGLIGGGVALLMIAGALKATALGIGILQVALTPAAYAAGILLATFRNLGVATGAVVTGIRNVATSLASGLATSLRLTAAGLVTIARGAMSMASSLARAAVAGGTAIVSGLMSAVSRIPSLVATAARAGFSAATSAASKFSTELRYWISRPFEYFKAITPLFAADLQLGIANAMARIKAASSIAADGVRAGWAAAVAMVNAAVASASAYIAGRFTAVAGRMAAVASPFVAAWSAAAGAIASRAVSVWNSVFGSASGMLSRLHARFAATIPLIGQDLNRLLSYASATGSAVVAAWRFVGPRIAAGLTTAVSGAFARIRAMAVSTGSMLGRGIGAGFRGLGGLAAGGAGLLGELGLGAGGMLGRIGMIVPQVLMLASSLTMLINPATLAIAAIAGGIYVWTQFSAEGKAAVAAVSEALAPLVQTAQTTFDGVSAAIQSGNLALAGKIAMAGLKLAAIDGMIALKDALIGSWGGTAGALSGEMSGGMVTPFEQVLETLGALWDQWCVGVVRTFTNAAREVITVWRATTEGLANKMLEIASQDTIWGKLMSKILGVDVRAEIERGNKLNKDLGLKPEDILGGLKKDVAKQIGQTADGLTKIADNFDKEAEEKARASEARLPNLGALRGGARNELDALTGEAGFAKAWKDFEDELAKLNAPDIEGVAGGGKAGEAAAGMLSSKSIGATFSAAAAEAMGRGGVGGNPQERAAKAAEKQVQQMQESLDFAKGAAKVDVEFLKWMNDAKKFNGELQEVMKDVERNTRDGGLG